MNKEYFTDNISVEKMAALIDKTIKFEKNNKKDRFKNMNIIYKIVPTAAAVALIFGAVNLPIFKNSNNPENPASNAYISATETTDSISNPGSLMTSIVPITSAASSNQINITDNKTKGIKQLTINVNPKNSSKFKGSSGNNTYIINSVTLNMGDYTADGIEIYFTSGTVIKTHDTVKVDEDRVIIAGDTIIDSDGNIVKEGKGKFSITDKNGIETAVNGGNQSRYTGNDPDGDANISYNKDGVKGIVDFLPYMSQKAIDSIAAAEYEKAGKLNKVDTTLLYTMSEDLLGELALKEYEKSGSISSSILPFVSDEAIDEIVRKQLDTKGNISSSMLPFVSDEVIDEAARKQYEKSGSIPSSMLPFVSDEVINEIAKNQIDSNVNIPSSMLPFLSQKEIDKLVRENYEKSGLKGLSTDILVFMSTKAVDELAEKEYDKNGLKNLKSGTFENIWVFMSQSAVDKIARKEYEKNGFKNFHDMLFIFMSDELIRELVTDESSEYWNIFPWMKYYDSKSKTDTFTLKDGTIIETANQYSTYGDLMSRNAEKRYGFMQPTKSITIKLSNGITITAPGGTTVKATPAENADHKVEITIGGNGGTLKKSDGTSSALPKGTILDGKGNIVK